MDSDILLERLEKMSVAVADYAKAKADRVYLEQFRKSKKAILMRSTDALKLKTQSEREQYAYAHDEYLQLLDGLRCAVEIEEKHKWALDGLKMQVDIWRTCQANDRWQKDRV